MESKELISGYTSYVQDMSSTDGKQPFIVRRMSNEWGFDFLGDPGFIQNLAGGFMRTTGSPHIILAEDFIEKPRFNKKDKIYLNNRWYFFCNKTILITITKQNNGVKNLEPLSLASIQGLVGIERNFLFGTTYEGILGGNATSRT